MVIRADKFFIQVLREAGYDLSYSELRELYRQSRKLAEAEKRKNKCEKQLEFGFLKSEFEEI